MVIAIIFGWYCLNWMEGVIRMSNQLITLMRHGAICLALGLTFSAAAFAQTPVAGQTTQTQLSSAEIEGKPVKEDKKESKQKARQRKIKRIHHPCWKKCAKCAS